jgi:hypothetical protein
MTWGEEAGRQGETKQRSAEEELDAGKLQEKHAPGLL